MFDDDDEVDESEEETTSKLIPNVPVTRFVSTDSFSVEAFEAIGEEVEWTEYSMTADEAAKHADAGARILKVTVQVVGEAVERVSTFRAF